MTIVIVVSTAGNTGVENVVYNLVEALIKHSDIVNLEVVTFAEGPLIAKLSTLNVPVTVAPISGKFDILGICKLMAYLSKSNGLLHAHGPRAALLAGAATLFSRKPKVVTIHRWGFEDTRSKIIGHTKTFVEKLVYKFIFDRRIFVSSAIMNAFHGQKVRICAKDIVIYNCISQKYIELDMSQYNSYRQTQRSIYGFNKNQIIIGCVGRLNAIKGQQYLLHAFSEIESAIGSIKLLLVGDGPDKHKLLSLASELHIEKDVFFTGNVTDSLELYCAMDLLVIPSISESFGLTLVEGTCAGIPIVASNCKALQEVGAGIQNLHFVEKQNSEALKDGIIFQMNSCKRPNSRINTTPNKTEISNYTPSKFRNAHLKLYKQLIDANN